MSKDKVVPFIDLGDNVDYTNREVKPFPSSEVTVAVTFTENFYQTNRGKLPTIDDFDWLAGFGYGKKKTERLLQSPEFREGLARRGISWSRHYDAAQQKALNVLTPQQQFVLLTITDPTNNQSLRAKLDRCGVTYAQHRNWMRKPEYANALNTLAEDMIGDNMASIHTSVAQKAMSGDIQAARLAYELTGRHDPAKQQMLDLSRILGLVLESLTRHVTDGAVLKAVTEDLDIIISGDTPQIEGPQADFSVAIAQLTENNVEDAVVVEDSTVTTAEEAEPTEAPRDETNVPKGFFDL